MKLWSFRFIWFLWLIQHFTNELFCVFKSRINLVLRKHLVQFVNIVLVETHNFALDLVFFFVKLHHILPHKFFNIKVVISGTGCCVSPIISNTTRSPRPGGRGATASGCGATSFTYFWVFFVYFCDALFLFTCQFCLFFFAQNIRFNQMIIFLLMR